MKTRIGTVVLRYFAETGRTSIGYADVEALAIVIARAGWFDRSERRARLELFAALQRDERFIKRLVRSDAGIRQRKARTFYVADATKITVAELELPALTLPPDPWRRRRFIGTLLDIDPHAVTDTLAAAVLLLLPSTMIALPHNDQQRIIAAFGLDGRPMASYTDLAAAEQCTPLTIRSSVSLDLGTLGYVVRLQLGAVLTQKASQPAELPGDALFWERVDRSSGTCWFWTGGVDKGYPIVKRNRKKYSARRYVYELLYGPVPEGPHITLDCGNMLCLRPEHLVAALPSEIAGNPLRR
jgi:hypothetical protein